MKKLAPGFLVTLVGLTVMSFSGGAAAQSTWNVGSTCNPTPIQSSYTAGGNTVSCATGIPAETITMTAYSNAGTTAGTTGNYVRASIGDFNSSGVGVYSGSGESGIGSQHAMDNVTTNCIRTGSGTTTSPYVYSGSAGTTGCGGSQEFMLVNFGPYKVNLNSISIGYRDTDADVAILRWDGANKTASEMDTLLKGASSLSSVTGWSLVATESMNDATPDTSSVNLGTKVSSWWIVSTYFGTAAATTAGTLDTGNDRFKLSALTGTVCTSGNYTGGTQGNGGTCGPSTTTQVPEPGMLATLGVALLGAMVARRRSQRRG